MRNIIILLVLALLASCTYKPKDKTLTKFKNNDSKIIRSFYKIEQDTIFWERLLSNKADLILQSGKIFRDKYYLTNQSITSTQNFIYDDTIVDSLIARLKGQGLAPISEDVQVIMFVQIIPDSGMSNLDILRFLNLRHRVEGKIDNALKSQQSGEWFAGDLGAGANMLFFVKDWNKASESVLSILKAEDLLEHVLVAKRIPISKEDWEYEIVYPIEYQGVFNSM